MHKLINSLQNYAWGSRHALADLYGIVDPQQRPVAEMWMGAHPKSPSFIVTAESETCSLREVIAKDSERLLGHEVAARFGELPFLFKVICADQPLSIQVHPSKAAAEAGFARENGAGIPLSAPERNYKDANHKPELVFALTPFLAMNGFRERHEIVSLLQPIAGAHPAIGHFLQSTTCGLAELFSALLSMQGDEKQRALDVLKARLCGQNDQPWRTVKKIAEYYPDDSGLFSPLLLNVIELQPGEAMFLFAGTPHAYLEGVALEVMANSDNVLRAGLTPKHIDIRELMANLTFAAKPFTNLLTQPVREGHSLFFPVPVADFAFSLHQLSETPLTLAQQSAAILFCVDGQTQINDGHSRLTLEPGESCFIPANRSPVTLCGKGRTARVYNQPGDYG
ncbi:mannose-6-phosphate isomerase [Erwinia psidii]|uniref:mannose-6-phosphate isomerase n=1 Tax=Erwinia psidii TaxID=69224 RepID=UPI00226B5DEE|nr:mannose-6-phosphate isomerase [Erwinia psidii]MCX8963715.1 mannose-6-phosphate isomerase [Erwinia psidii]